jgi:hypothetical protein
MLANDGSTWEDAAPPEFRRKVLDLVEAGRPIAEVAQALGRPSGCMWITVLGARLDDRQPPLG